MVRMRRLVRILTLRTLLFTSQTKRSTYQLAKRLVRSILNGVQRFNAGFDKIEEVAITSFVIAAIGHPQIIAVYAHTFSVDFGDYANEPMKGLIRFGTLLVSLGYCLQIIYCCVSD